MRLARSLQPEGLRTAWYAVCRIHCVASVPICQSGLSRTGRRAAPGPRGPTATGSYYEPCLIVSACNVKVYVPTAVCASSESCCGAAMRWTLSASSPSASVSGQARPYRLLSAHGGASVK